MNIILGTQSANELQDRYVVLELDTFRFAQDNDPVTAYCVIDHVPIGDIPMIAYHRDLHQDLLQNYKDRQWPICLDLIDKLQGRWNGELDEFYHIMARRISDLEKSELGPDWDAVITK